MKEVKVTYQCQNCFAEQVVTFIKCKPTKIVECDKCGKTSIQKIKEQV